MRTLTRLILTLVFAFFALCAFFITVEWECEWVAWASALLSPQAETMRARLATRRAITPANVSLVRRSWVSWLFKRLLVRKGAGRLSPDVRNGRNTWVDRGGLLCGLVFHAGFV